MLVFLAVTAGATTCDPKPIVKELAAASPVAAGDVYVRLAACDAAAAKAQAKLALSKTVEGPSGAEAVVAAARVGAQAEILSWVGALEPDVRTRTMNALGKRCGSETGVQKLFVDAASQLGDAFYKERWYRDLTQCRVPEVTALLLNGLDHPQYGSGARDRAQFFGMLETYARNAGAAAIPRLVTALGAVKDPREIRVVLPIFADAAGVGGAVDEGSRKAALEALGQVAPTLPADVADSLRDTYRALGDEDAAGATASLRWPDRKVDGKYSYAVSATEVYTCKNGKPGALLHHGLVLDAGQRWPDAVETAVRAEMPKLWDTTAAAKCKGTGEVTWAVSTEPVDEASAKAFFDAAAKAWAAKGNEKGTDVSEDTVALP